MGLEGGNISYDRQYSNYKEFLEAVTECRMGNLNNNNYRVSYKCRMGYLNNAASVVRLDIDCNTLL